MTIIQRIRMRNSRALFLMTTLITITFGSFLWTLNTTLNMQLTTIENNNFPTLKTSTNEEWNRQFGSNSYDIANGVTVDDDGNVYVIGTNFTDLMVAPRQDIMFRKYNQSGDLEWSVLWDGIQSNDDYGNDIALDSNGDVYAVGTVKDRVALSPNLILIKYSSEGIYQWNRTWYEASNYSKGYSLAIDSSNFIYVSGESSSPSGNNPEILVVKYDLNGNQIWNMTHSTSLNTFHYGGICIDSNNKIIIVGHNTSGGIDKDIQILKLNENDGSIAWQKTFNEAQKDLAYDVAVDSNDNIFIAGASGTDNPAGAIIKYDSAGTHQWNKTYLAYMAGVDAKGISIDNSTGDLYVGFKPVAADYQNITLFKLNNDGVYQWNKTWNTDADGYYEDNTGDVFFDPNGYIYVTGNTRTTVNNYMAVIIQYSNAPDIVTLSSNADQPIDQDGNYQLSWTTSLDANNYTVYNYTSLITDINGSLGRNKIQTTDTSCAIQNVNEGTYFYVIVAHNNYGNSTSNWINVTVQGLPHAFNLDVQFAGTPSDTDGIFTLSWDASTYADNYSLYWSTHQIADSNINASGDVFLLYNGTNLSKYTEDWTDGTYYFKIFAFNERGNLSSNSLFITVDLPGVDGDGLPWWAYPIITGIISAVVGIVIKQSYSSVKKRRVFMQNVTDKFEQVDNIEQFLKENLKYDEWQKLQEPLDKYKKRQISNKELIKQGKKELGKDFTDLLMGKKKPKS